METHKKSYYFYACLAFLIYSKDICSMQLAHDLQQLASSAISGASSAAHQVVDKSTETLKKAAANAVLGTADDANKTAHELINHTGQTLDRVTNRAIGQGAAQTSILMNQATRQSKEVINQASLFSWFCLPRFTQLVRYCKLSTFEGMEHGAKRYHEGVADTVAAARALGKDGKKGTHDIIEHAGEKAKGVIGTGINETKLATQEVIKSGTGATKEVIAHYYSETSLFRDETLVSIIAAIATVGGGYFTYQNLDNPSPKKSLFAGTLGILGSGYLFYKIRPKKQKLSECVINNTLDKPILSTTPEALSSSKVAAKVEQNLLPRAAVSTPEGARTPQLLKTHPRAFADWL